MRVLIGSLSFRARRTGPHLTTRRSWRMPGPKLGVPAFDTSSLGTSTSAYSGRRTEQRRMRRRTPVLTTSVGAWSIRSIGSLTVRSRRLGESGDCPSQYASPNGNALFLWRIRTIHLATSLVNCHSFMELSLTSPLVRRIAGYNTLQHSVLLQTLATEPHYPPRSLDQVDEMLSHKLVDVVVETVVYAVDLAQPTVHACPLPIAYPSLGEARHPAGGEVPVQGRARSRQTKKGSMTRSFPNPWLAQHERRSAPTRAYAHARA